MSRNLLQREWLILLPILLITAGQILSKQGALLADQTGFPVNAYILSGYACLVLRGVIWIFVLKALRLANAYPILSLTYVLILGVSWYAFDERISLARTGGCLLIVAGIASVAVGEKRVGEASSA